MSIAIFYIYWKYINEDWEVKHNQNQARNRYWICLAEKMVLVFYMSEPNRSYPNILIYKIYTGVTMVFALVTSLGCWWRDLSRVRHQHQISVTKITFWRIMMLATDVSPSGLFTDTKKLYWIWHQVEFNVSNITYRSPTSHSSILWCWWPIGISPTCRKMSPTYFFVTNISKW